MKEHQIGCKGHLKNARIVTSPITISRTDSATHTYPNRRRA